MSSNSVPTTDSNVNAPPDEVYVWADRSGERGLLNPTTARLKVTALKRILSVLLEDEHLGAQEILKTLDQLVTRLARKEGGNPETLSTYKQRAESLLRDFVDYQQDPLGFQSRSSERPPKAERRPERKKAVPLEPSVEPTAELQVPTGKRYVYPLDAGRDFEYSLPVGGLTMREVKKIALLLISLATDYEPPGDSVADLTRRVKSLDLLKNIDAENVDNE